MRLTPLAATMTAWLGAAALVAAMPAVAAPSSDAIELQQLHQQIDALQEKVDQLDQHQKKEATATTVSSWTDSTKLGAKMYFDATQLSQKFDGQPGTADGFGFDVKRFYLSVDHVFDHTWSMDLTTDFHYSSSDGKSTIFVKKAYVQGAFSPLFTVRAGAADTPWIPYEEKLYGFRYIEPTVEDRIGLISSSDWGVHAFGAAGLFDYQLSVVSGGTYNHVNFRTRQPDVALRIGVHPLEGFTFAAGAYAGKRGQSVGGGPSVREGLLSHVLLGYVGHGWRLGGEYFTVLDPHTYGKTGFAGTKFPTLQTNALLRDSKNRSDRGSGYSLWASYEITTPVTLFARFDHVRPSHDVDPSLRETYFNVGAQYAVRPGIDLALVYKHDRLHDRLHTLRDNEAGLYAQMQF